MPPKLVIIEGVPGSGKSTLAEKLAGAFSRHGLKACHYHEHDAAHPIMRPGEPGAMYDPARRINRWSTWIDVLSDSEELVVLESSLFQRQTNAFVGDFREGEVDAFITAVYRCLEKVPAALIYFTQSDMRSHFEWLEKQRPGALAHFAALLKPTPFASRYGADAFELVTSYFARVESFTEPLARRFPGKRCFIDGSQKNWPSQYESVSRCLGVSFCPS